MILRFRYLLFFFLFSPTFSFAQDTLSVRVEQADSLFLKNNFLLLAKRYDVDASQALIRQARLWDNPSFFTEVNLYNPDKSKFFDAGANGQKIFTVQQVIYLSGKRNKQIELAKQNAKLSELEFYNMMRELKLELRSNFYNIYFNSKTLRKYDYQLNLLQTIIEAFDVQYKKGNIPLKEVLRLKAVYYRLNNERTDLMSNVLDAQKNLKILLQTTQTIKPIVDDSSISIYTYDKINTDDVLKKALEFRPDLQTSALNTLQAETSLKLQRRTAIPNMYLGGTYDQAGSYVNNYTGINLSIDLPVWNRNQGNIAYAKAMVKSAKVLEENKHLEVQNEVLTAVERLRQVESEYNKIDSNFRTDIEMLNKGVLENFQKRNISLLEFIDFFEAYNESIGQLNTLRARRISSYEELNYITGTELFKP